MLLSWQCKVSLSLMIGKLEIGISSVYVVVLLYSYYLCLIQFSNNPYLYIQVRDVVTGMWYLSY